MPKPFRWSIEKREQLGGLLKDWADVEPYDLRFLPELRSAAARVIALADDADLAFIGRTPENFFDFLSGVFCAVGSTPTLHLIQISLSRIGSAGVTSVPHHDRTALFGYFSEEGIDPASIAKGNRPLALVDYIDSGGSMKSFIELLQLHAVRDGVDWNAVQRRLRIIGLLSRTKTSPNTWRWQQHQDWLDIIPDAVIKNVSAPPYFLRYIAGQQPKVTKSFDPRRWGSDFEGAEDPTEEQREALAIAASLFDKGRTQEERLKLAAEIAETQQMRQTATRTLVTALRRAG